MHGRVDGDDPSAGEAGEDAVVSQDDVFDIGVGHHTDTDDLTIPCELGRRRGDDGGRVRERFQGLRAARPDGERMTGIDDAARHRCPLAAESDEACAGHVYSWMTWSM